MSPKFTSLTAAGLAAMGLGWGVTRGVAQASPQDPAAPAVVRPPQASPPEAGAAAVPAPPADAPTVLLLSNGTVLHGEIVQDPGGYYLKHRLGVQHHARRNVLGAFRSVEEAYQFKLGRLPQQDADEQLKIAQWCLEQKLTDQAKGHLGEVLALNPENRRAKAMLFVLESRTSAPADEAVARTAGTADATGLDPAMPRELSPSTLDRLRTMSSERRPVGPPVIFDLPAPLALRRYQEFGRRVHLELQARCAKCHNADTYSGDFRLVYARTRKDLQNELLVRTNLDAVLRLVDPYDLGRSELLTVAGLTHPPDGRPVLSGPNDPSYRVLQQWVGGLQDPAAVAARGQAGTGVAPAGYQAPTGGGFAAGRMPSASGPSPVQPATVAGQPITAPPGAGVVQGFTASEYAVSPNVPPDAQFPVPDGLPAIPPGATAAGTPPPGQALPGLDMQAGPTGALAPLTPGPAAPQPPGTVVQLADGSQGIVLPNGDVAPFVSSQSLKPGSPRPTTVPGTTPPPTPAATPTPGPASPATDPEPAGDGKAQSKIDPAALQKFLMNRGGPR